MKVFASSKENLKLLSILEFFTHRSSSSLEKLANYLDYSHKTVRAQIKLLKQQIIILGLIQSFSLEIKHLRVYFIVHHQFALIILKKKLIHDSRAFEYMKQMILQDSSNLAVGFDFLLQLEKELKRYRLTCKRGYIKGKEECIQKFIYDFMKVHLMEYRHSYSQSIYEYIKIKMNVNYFPTVNQQAMAIFF
ncbi:MULTISPECIES: HTH domain-containing protein [unclassified Enterococcus]|uniref:HTH domain-containing protein n=1 Tax=unclassified Enterococcus TaxID=2608891 RepID=UPI0015533F5D|nr:MULTISPECIES: HTH domain-containing protein [unclassified Enterococcus]MBS7577577.1 HTH domain-containing protein [Enterococcus sp. MMGLQ5-2]MBS7584924.1 HTH domain-containing protein [Enterococcus sp. MMGLQ5-1]NPD12779.1 HTH domain-containing protein [Enterococcus sp. MMGLQ5-1]NPD37410.1 HTH domain-containing protein [Enterococcus sp. MMGLQ5-2]